MLADISFPPPIPYEADEGQEGPPGTAYQAIDERLVKLAFKVTSRKKSPGPDGIGPLAIRCVYDWEPDRVATLIRTHIGLGTHHGRLKTARGVAIPKPGKDYGLAKSYRAILLLNYLGKMVKKVAAMVVSTHCETTEASTRANTAVEPSGQLSTPLDSSDPGGVEPRMHHRSPPHGRRSLLSNWGCLLQKMRGMGLGEGLVRWTDSFMRDRWVIVDVGGQDGEPMNATTGLPQGSLTSLVLFAIYIADIYEVVES